MSEGRHAARRLNSSPGQDVFDSLRVKIVVRGGGHLLTEWNGARTPLSQGSGVCESASPSIPATIRVEWPWAYAAECRAV